MPREIISLENYIDHTLLRPTVTNSELAEFCKKALEFNFASVCIPPHFVKEASNILFSSTINTCTVIGFPLGYTPKEIKLMQINQAMKDGAEELDVVINQSFFQSENYDELQEEMNILADTVHSKYGIIKFIVETAYLSKIQNKKALEMCLEAKADYIKTSTGFASKGAELPTIKQWKKLIGTNKLKIKASGGIKNSKEAVSFITAGADRIGCSKGISIVEEYEKS